jgi:hypothetical protein
MLGLFARRFCSITEQVSTMTSGILGGNKVYQFQPDSEIDKATMTEFHVYRFTPGSVPYV